MTQPPGKRTKPGLRSAIICAMSGRKPFARFFHVLRGNNDTKSNHTFPFAPAEITRRAFDSVFVGLRVALNCFQEPPIFSTFTSSQHAAPAAPPRRTSGAP